MKLFWLITNFKLCGSFPWFVFLPFSLYGPILRFFYQHFEYVRDWISEMKHKWRIRRRIWCIYTRNSDQTTTIRYPDIRKWVKRLQQYLRYFVRLLYTLKNESATLLNVGILNEAMTDKKSASNLLFHLSCNPFICFKCIGSPY